MSIERYGQIIEFRGEDGIRYVARITSVQLLADVDELAEEAYVTIAGRMILARSSLDEFREALLDDRFHNVINRGWIQGPNSLRVRPYQSMTPARGMTMMSIANSSPSLTVKHVTNSGQE